MNSAVVLTPGSWIIESLRRFIFKIRNENKLDDAFVNALAKKIIAIEIADTQNDLDT